MNDQTTNGPINVSIDASTDASKELNHYVRLALLRLAKVKQKQSKDLGYSQENMAICVLEELLKEQVNDEDTSYSTR